MPTYDQPEAGFYAMRLARRALPVPVRLAFTRPVVERHQLDRSPRWLVLIDGVLSDDDVFETWAWCAGSPIARREYRFLIRRGTWARQHVPEHPAANPYDAIDVRRLPPAF
jgi:hypothetical protein